MEGDGRGLPDAIPIWLQILEEEAGRIQGEDEERSEE
jgi:hypothetical protein